MALSGRLLVVELALVHSSIDRGLAVVVERQWPPTIT
jgi:hypothetical protein